MNTPRSLIIRGGGAHKIAFGLGTHVLYNLGGRRGSSASALVAVAPAMEDCLVRCTRLQMMMGIEAYEEFIDDYGGGWETEQVELNGRGREMFRNGEWNWETLCMFLCSKIGWVGDGILLDGTHGYGGVSISFCQQTHPILILGGTSAAVHGVGALKIWASPETTQASQTAVCDLVLQSFTGCKITKVVSLTSGFDFPNGSACPFSGPALARFLTQSTDSPEIKLKHFELDEEHCQALVTIEGVREGLVISLHHCRLTEAGERVLFDGIRRNRGPTSLYGCRFNAQPLAEALNGHTRIQKFQCPDGEGITDEDVLFLFRTLAENLGIETLNLARIQILDESWNVLCQSLANHPAIEYLNLAYNASHNSSSQPMAGCVGTYMVMSEARKTHRTQSLVETLKVNTTITAISLNPDQYENSIWRNEIEPRLEINMFRLRIVAVKKAQGSLRAPLFGRSLHAVNGNDTFIFMMVKGNVDCSLNSFRGRTIRAVGSVPGSQSKDGGSCCIVAVPRNESVFHPCISPYSSSFTSVQ